MTMSMTESAARTTAPDATQAVPKPAPPPRNVSVTLRGSPGNGRGSPGNGWPVSTASMVDIRDLTIPGGPVGQTRMRTFRPVGTTGTLPVVLYIHGASGDPGDDLNDQAGKLAIDLRCAVAVLPCNRPATAAEIEQIYAAAVWIAAAGSDHGLDRTRVALAANAAGAAVADELMLMGPSWRNRPGRPSVAVRAHDGGAPRSTRRLRLRADKLIAAAGHGGSSRRAAVNGPGNENGGSGYRRSKPGIASPLWWTGPTLRWRRPRRPAPPTGSCSAASCPGSPRSAPPDRGWTRTT